MQVATIEIVARDGFAAAAAETICQRAGVSKGLLWHYFDNLDDLLASAARHAFTTLKTAVAESIDTSTSPITEVMRSAVRRTALLPRTHADELRAVRQIVANLRAPDGSPRLGEAEYDGLYAGQAALMRRGQEEGNVRSDLDPLVLATIYQGMMDSMLSHLGNSPDIEHERYAEGVAAVLLGGITSPTAELAAGSDASTGAPVPPR